MNKDIAAYNKVVKEPELKEVCETLARLVDDALPKNAVSKIWYAQPVWFINDNPIVGYNVTKKGKVNLLFWSGRAFKEPGLAVEGSFKAAEIKYGNVSEIDQTKLNKWLKESAITMYNYKDIRKNRGQLSLI
jgi:hypothetical protein